MNWAMNVLAGLFEIGWAIGLKYSEGFTRLWPTLGTILSMIVSLGLLGLAMKTLPVGTAYAVWVGVGPSAPPSWAWCCSRSRRARRGCSASR